ncbi:MAG: hypothetical protein AB4080_09320 [Trichodesmium sp.]
MWGEGEKGEGEKGENIIAAPSNYLSDRQKMFFFIDFSPEKAEVRRTHNLSILSSFMLRKMWVKHS